MLDLMKEIAQDAILLSALADFSVGTITAVSPLKVRLEEGIELEERFLVLSRNVAEHEERGRIRTWSTNEGDSWSEYRSVRNKSLCVGEEVLLLKASGGQKYLILDRVYKGGA